MKAATAVQVLLCLALLSSVSIKMAVCQGLRDFSNSKHKSEPKGTDSPAITNNGFDPTGGLSVGITNNELNHSEWIPCCDSIFTYRSQIFKFCITFLCVCVCDCVCVVAEIGAKIIENEVTGHRIDRVSIDNIGLVNDSLEMTR